MSVNEPERDSYSHLNYLYDDVKINTVDHLSLD